MTSPSFVQRTPLMKVLMRDGAVDALGCELGLLGVRRPLLLCGASARRSALFARVVRQLDAFEMLQGPSVPAHSNAELVEQLAAMARERGCDAIVALGGGSASDTGKAVALLLAEGGRLADHATRFTPPATLHAPVLIAPKIPLVTIPATASGAEVTPSLGIRDAEGRKLLFTDIQLASRLVLIDPAANVEVPAALMLATGMNGLAHCLEGLYSLERSPLAEILALEAITRFARALAAVHRAPASSAARGELLYAAHLSGMVLVNARTCLHHAICHAIGAITGAGHGNANAVMLPHALEFNRRDAGPALGLATRAWAAGAGPGGAAARPIVPALLALREELGVPTRLRDIGVPRQALARIADKTMGERGLYYNPRTVADAGAVLDLLEQAF